MKKFLMGIVAVIALMSVNVAHAEDDPELMNIKAPSTGTCTLTDSSDIGRDDSSQPSYGDSTHSPANSSGVSY